jgi:hypothetical protein
VAASAGTSKTNASISITPSARLSGRFDARPEGGVIIQASRAPLLDAARLLMAKKESATVLHKLSEASDRIQSINASIASNGATIEGRYCPACHPASDARH